MARRVPARALGAFGLCAIIVVCAVYVTNSAAQRTKENQPQVGAEASPIYGVTIPPGRDWQLISVGHLAGGSLDQSGGKLMQLRAQLGNDIAMNPGRRNHRRAALE
jgi:hypothetical protein